MVCRILTRQEETKFFVRLAGRLGESQVPALLEVCASADRPVILELDDLISADPLGIDALLRLKQQGTTFIGLPEYIRLKFDVLTGEYKA